MKPQKLFLCILIVNLVACVPVPTPAPTRTAFPTETSFPTLLPSPLPTLTIAPTSTPELITKTCAEVKTDFSPETVDGAIVLNGAYEYYDKSVQHYTLNSGAAYMWNLQNNTKINLLHDTNDEMLEEFSVSPNHRWLAYAGEMGYSSTRKHSFVVTVVGADGKVIRSIPNAHNWFAIQNWINNQQLAIWMLSDVTSGAPFPTLIYGPFDQSRKVIIPNYPQISGEYTPGWDKTQTVYDPALELVVYAKQGVNGETEGIVLWDSTKQQRIAFIPNTMGIGNSNPVWSDDGQQFAIGINLNRVSSWKNSDYHVTQELFSVSRNGKTKRLTYLTTIYKDVEILSKSWSPDNRHIAFFYMVKPTSNPINFAVLDTFTGKIQDYCIENVTGNAPIWSPDGNKILLTGISGEDDKGAGYRVLLLDLQEKYVTEIAQNMQPEGWLVSQP
jgi:hypothetical protein